MDAKTLGNILSVMGGLNSASSAQSNLPVCASVWCTDGYLVATNLEQTIMIPTSLSFPHPVDIREFANAVRVMKGDIAVEAKKDGIVIASRQGSKAVSYNLSIDEMPKFKPTPRQTGVNIQYAALRHAAKVASKEQVRMALTGLYFDSASQLMVGTDGRRLHTAPMTSQKKFPNIIVPRVACKAMLAIMKSPAIPYFSVDHLSVSDDSKDKPMLSCFHIGEAMVRTQNIEQNFPEYREVVPNLFRVSVTIPAELAHRAAQEAVDYVAKPVSAMKKALRDLKQKRKLRWDNAINTKISDLESKIKAKEDYRMKFLFSGDTARFQVDQRHEKAIAMPCKIQGDAGAMQYLTLNPSFFLDSMWNDKVTTIQANGQNKAIVVDGCSVVMPLRPTTWTGAESRQITKYDKAPVGKIPLIQPKPLDPAAPKARKPKATKPTPEPEPQSCAESCRSCPPPFSHDRGPKPKTQRKPKATKPTPAPKAEKPKPKTQRKPKVTKPTPTPAPKAEKPKPIVVPKNVKPKPRKRLRDYNLLPMPW